MPWSWWPAVVLIVAIGILEVAGGFSYEIYVPTTIFLVGFFIVPLIITGRARVQVVDGVLRSGKNSVRVTELTSIKSLDRETTRLQLGPRADPAATLIVRGWIKESVIARMANPHPTPYWLITTRHPHELATALKQARLEARADR